MYIMGSYKYEIGDKVQVISLDEMEEFRKKGIRPFINRTMEKYASGRSSQI